MADQFDHLAAVFDRQRNIGRAERGPDFHPEDVFGQAVELIGVFDLLAAAQPGGEGDAGQVPGAIVADQAGQTDVRAKRSASGHEPANFSDVFAEGFVFRFERGEDVGQPFEFGPAALHFAENALKLLHLIFGEDEGHRGKRDGGGGPKAKVQGPKTDSQRGEKSETEITEYCFCFHMVLYFCCCESR